VKAQIFFTGSIFLSLAVHALVLFTPSISIPKPPVRNEPYRVKLIQKPVATAIQEKPKPRKNPEKSHTKVANDREPAEDVEEKELTNAAESQPRQNPDHLAKNQAELRTVSSAYRTNRRTPVIPRSSNRTSTNDYQRILGELNRMLHAQLRYPEVARRRGIEGAVAVTLTLNTNGSASNMIVSDSSGSRILDRAALRAISDIFTYTNTTDTPLHFTIPVTYRLTDSK
jgi:protein TonB